MKGNDVTILDGLDVPSVEMSLAWVLNDTISRTHSSCHIWLDLYSNNKVDEEEKHRVAAVRRTLRARFKMKTSVMCTCDVIKVLRWKCLSYCYCSAIYINPVWQPLLGECKILSNLVNMIVSRSLSTHFREI